jgi:hypothetical protein
MPEPKTTSLSDGDLDLLLAEADRDDPFLNPAMREGSDEPRESLDSQILAGLVSP